MISAVSKNGAAISAKRIIKTAPIAKFGTITAFVGALEEFGELDQLGLGESGGPDDRVHVVRRAPTDVLPGRVEHGEVDRDLGAGDLELMGFGREPDCTRVGTRVHRVDRGDKLHVGGFVDGATHSRSHPPAGTEHTDPNHVGGAYEVTLPSAEGEFGIGMGADDRQRAGRAREDAVDDPGNVVGGDGFDAGDQLLEARDLTFDQLRAPEAAHPTRRCLQRHRERPDQ